MPDSQSIGSNLCYHRRKIACLLFSFFYVTFSSYAQTSIPGHARSIVRGTGGAQSEIIMRQFQYKARKYLTSGGKEYVSDGIVGRHSHLQNKIIEALEKGISDGIFDFERGYYLCREINDRISIRKNW